MAVSKTLNRICKKAIQEGYMVSNDEGLKPTSNALQACLAMQDALEVLDEFKIYLWKGNKKVGAFFIVDNRDKWDTEAVLSDYSCDKEHEAFMIQFL